MTHPNAFDGLLGLVTLHPLLTFGPALILLGFGAILASRRRPPPPALRRRSEGTTRRDVR
jgi:hypothetical protein